MQSSPYNLDPSAQPPWTACLHLMAGTCPAVASLAPAIWAEEQERPALNQDLALIRLGLICADCALAPRMEG